MVVGLTKVSDERQRRQLDREAAGLPDAALHLLGARAEMGVARIDVGPGVDDRDDRLAHEVGVVVAHLAQPRAMAEGAQIAGAEPAMAAQVFGRFAFSHSGGGSRLDGSRRRAAAGHELRSDHDGGKHGARSMSVAQPGSISSRPADSKQTRCQ